MEVRLQEANTFFRFALPEYSGHMLSRHSCFPRVTAVVLLAFAAAMSRAEQARSVADPIPPLAIDGLGKGTVSLDGPWQFRLGDDPAWAAPSFSDSGWEQLTADRPWGAQGHARTVGFAWYRLHIALSPASDVPPEFSLLLPRVDDAYEIYWNGLLIGRNGKLEPRPVWYASQPAQSFALGRAQSGVLAVRVWKAPLLSDDSGQTGGFEAPPVVGSPEAVADAKAALDYEWLHSRQFLFTENLLFGLVALLSFLAWRSNRSQRLLFWMTGFALAPVLTLLLLDAHLSLPYVFAMGAAQPVDSIQNISLWFLLLWLLNLHEDRTLLRLTCVLATVRLAAGTLDGLLVAISWNPSWIGLTQLSDAALTSLEILIGVLPIVLVAFALIRRQGLDSARWMVAIFAFLDEMIVVVRDTANQGRQFTQWKIADRIDSGLFTLGGNAISIDTLASVLLIASIVFAVYKSFRETEGRQNRLEQEFRNAGELQRLLIPEAQPSIPGFDLTSCYRPAQEVGGDFFQVIPLEGASAGSTLLILGDVSGKGLQAAMSVSLLVGAAQALADFVPGPAQVLGELNRRLCGRLHGGFATCVALQLDSDGTCVLSTAGHPAPYLNQHELDLPGALPLGLFETARYEQTVVQLHSGDHLALYTDGLLEARSHSGELYGFNRLQSLFATKPNAAQAAEAAIGFGQDDDITVLTLVRLAPGEERSVPRPAIALN
jgi:hypothetical protein